MTDFPNLSYTSASEIPTLSYTWSPKKVPLSGITASPCIGHYKEYPPGPVSQLCIQVFQTGLYFNFNIFILSILTSRRQLENPGHYDDLENYYHSYKNCVLRNNYIPSPTDEKLPGLDEIPVLKVLTYLH